MGEKTYVLEYDMHGVQSNYININDHVKLLPCSEPLLIRAEKLAIYAMMEF